MFAPDRCPSFNYYYKKVGPERGQVQKLVEDFLKIRNSFSPLAKASNNEEDSEDEDPEEPTCSLFMRSPLDSAVEAIEDTPEKTRKRALASPTNTEQAENTRNVRPKSSSDK